MQLLLQKMRVHVALAHSSEHFSASCLHLSTHSLYTLSFEQTPSMNVGSLGGSPSVDSVLQEVNATTDQLITRVTCINQIKCYQRSSNMITFRRNHVSIVWARDGRLLSTGKPLRGATPTHHHHVRKKYYNEWYRLD